MTTSVIIPAKNEQYLEQTIRNVLSNARGDIEVIAVLDGWTPDPQIVIGDDRVKFLHFPESIGQRKAINEGVAIATGKYIMKLDAHCAVDEGFDVKLASDCEYSWTVVPRMYNLDIATFTPKKHKLTDYMYISSPTAEKPFRMTYYTGSEYKRQHSNKLAIDDTMCCVGCGWFMHRQRFLDQGGCDEGHVGGWGQQGIEVALKAWLSGGALKVNKKTWFAHYFRGGVGFPYEISGKQVERVRKYSQDLWLNDKWDKATRKLQWVIDKFNPPEWKESIPMTPNSQWSHIGSSIIDVEIMYNHRDDYCDPRKRSSLEWFKRCFPPFLQAIHGGNTFTDEELENYDYYNYLINKLHPADKVPVLTGKGKRHVIKLMRSVEKLYADIKENGLRNPLDLWRYGNKFVLHRGGRRLEILHLLGYSKVPLRIFKSKDDYIKFKPTATITEDDSIHCLGMKQFQKLKERSTDKYWVHDYLRLYDRHIGYLRPTAKKILEIGVFRGASLLLWKQAFRKASIYGVDKNTRIWQKYLKGQRRIKVFVGRQEDTEFLEREVIPNGKYDIIIDDGCHLPREMQTSFKLLWDSVESGGWYVIEDLYGNYRKDRIKDTTMSMLKNMIDEMNLKGEIKSMHFYYNICFVEKR